MSSYATRKSHGKRGAQILDRIVADAVAEQEQRARDEAERVKAERAAALLAAAERPKLTAADLASATLVRDRTGWHKVVRVNATTVTVQTPWSWTERIKRDHILEARTSPTKEQS